MKFFKTFFKKAAVDTSHDFQIKPRELQTSVNFDGGRVIESRPVTVHHDNSPRKYGPLFSWAWAKAIDKANTGLHPHGAFEVLTAVLKGSLHHIDNMGSDFIIGAGGAMYIQAGSGITHEEIIDKGSEYLQIWFEPWIKEARLKEPVCLNFSADKFPAIKRANAEGRILLGPLSSLSIQFDTDAIVEDWQIGPAGELKIETLKQRVYCILCISGQLRLEVDKKKADVRERDFVRVMPEGKTLRFTAAGRMPARLFLISVPEKVDYPLYPLF